MRNLITLTVLFVVFAAANLFADNSAKADTSALTTYETEAAFFYNADVSKLDTTKPADRAKYRSIIKKAKARFDKFATKYSVLVTVGGSTAKKFQARINELESGKADVDILINTFAKRGAAVAASDTTNLSDTERVRALNFLLNPDDYQDKDKKLNAVGRQLQKNYIPKGLDAIPTLKEVEKLISQ